MVPLNQTSRREGPTRETCSLTVKNIGAATAQRLCGAGGEKKMAEENPVAGVARAGAATSRNWGIALVVLGVLCIAAPFVAGAFTAMMIGVALIAAGIVITVGGIQADSWGIGIFALLIGVVTGLAGVYMLARPVLGMVSIALALAVYFLVDGVFQIVGALQARPAKGWGWFLFGGIVSVFLGYIIYSDWPVSGAWVVGTLVGIRLLFGGWTLMMLGGAQAAIADAIEES
jgi:uncharacterized membrane protein HdeD (DUF308 family)